MLTLNEEETRSAFAEFACYVWSAINKEEM